MSNCARKTHHRNELFFMIFSGNIYTIFMSHFIEHTMSCTDTHAVVWSDICWAGKTFVEGLLVDICLLPRGLPTARTCSCLYASSNFSILNIISSSSSGNTLKDLLLQANITTRTDGRQSMLNGHQSNLSKFVSLRTKFNICSNKYVYIYICA